MSSLPISLLLYILLLYDNFCYFKANNTHSLTQEGRGGGYTNNDLSCFKNNRPIVISLTKCGGGQKWAICRDIIFEWPLNKNKIITFDADMAVRNKYMRVKDQFS